MPDKKPSENTGKNASERPKGQKVLDEMRQEEEFGGTNGLEPTRYGDWEHGGRCSDF